MSNRLKLLRERATRPRRTVPVLLDGEVREQIEAVEDALDRLDAAEQGQKRLNTRTNAAERAKLLAELEHLHESAIESTLFLVVEGLPGSAYEALTAQHPPRSDGEGKRLLSDLGGVNATTFRRPVIRACVVGHRERPETDAPVLPVDDETLDWLLGTDEAPGFATDRQIQLMAEAAIGVNRGDDAVPLPRRRSTTTPSDAG